MNLSCILQVFVWRKCMMFVLCHNVKTPTETVCDLTKNNRIFFPLKHSQVYTNWCMSLCFAKRESCNSRVWPKYFLCALFHSVWEWVWCLVRVGIVSHRIFAYYNTRSLSLLQAQSSDNVMHCCVHQCRRMLNEMNNKKNYTLYKRKETKQQPLNSTPQQFHWEIWQGVLCLANNPPQANTQISTE